MLNELLIDECKFMDGFNMIYGWMILQIELKQYDYGWMILQIESLVHPLPIRGVSNTMYVFSGNIDSVSDIMKPTLI